MKVIRHCLILLMTLLPLLLSGQETFTNQTLEALDTAACRATDKRQGGTYDSTPSYDYASRIHLDLSEFSHSVGFDSKLRLFSSSALPVRADGRPMAPVACLLNGHASLLCSNEPLYLINEVPLVNSPVNQLTPEINPLWIVAPIQNTAFDAQTNPFGTAQQGAMGANGTFTIIDIPYICYKDTGLIWTVYSQLTFSEAVKKIDVLNGYDWLALSLEAIGNRYGEDSPEYQTQFASYQDYFGNDPFNQVPSVNWQNELFRETVSQKYALNFRLIMPLDSQRMQVQQGGLYYSQEPGIVKFSGWEQIGGRWHLQRCSRNPKKTPYFGLIAALNHGRFEAQPTGSDGSNPVLAGLLTLPINAAYNDDGSLNTDSLLGYYDYNPLFESAHNELTANITQANIDFKLKGMLLKDRVYVSVLSSLYGWLVNERDFRHPESYTGRGDNGRLDVAQTQALSNYNSAGIDYEFFKDTSSLDPYDQRFIRGSLFIDYLHNYQSVLLTGGHDFPDLLNDGLSAAKLIDYSLIAQSRWQQVGIRSWHTFDISKVYLSLGLTFNSNSRWGSDVKGQWYPAVVLGWRAYQSFNFHKDFPIKRLEAAYGRSGNGIFPAYWADGQYSATDGYQGQAGLATAIMPNPELQPEYTDKFQVGGRLSALGGLFNLDVNYFYHHSKDLILRQKLPPSAGADYQYINSGELLSQGLACQLYIPVDYWIDFEWHLGANVGYAQNHFIRLLTDSTAYNALAMVDKPYGAEYLTEWAGVNPADGRPMWCDKDGELTYKPTSYDKKWTGQRSPSCWGQVYNKFVFYKYFVLSTTLEWAVGHSAYNSTRQYLNRSGNTLNMNQTADQYADRWQQVGQLTAVAQPMAGSYYQPEANRPYDPSTRFLEPLDYFKIREITLSYTFSDFSLLSVSQKLKCSFLRELKLFVQLYNYFTFTNYSGYDPEFTGNDLFLYPQSKQIHIGLELQW